MIEQELAWTAAANAAYDATYTDVVRHGNASISRVWLEGADRAALLQRLTTNDVVRLQPGDGVRTVLVNSIARILDVLTVYALPDALLVTTGVGQGATLARFLQSKIFFGDKVRVHDRTDVLAHVALYGPHAAALVEQATGVVIADWPLHHVAEAHINSVPVHVVRMLPLGGEGVGIIVEPDHLPTIETAFAGAVPLDDATLDVLRIEAGYGAPRHEWSTDYIPLEANLGDAISFAKGCYTGQEIIARMDSRNRLAKRLMGLRFAHDVAPGSALLGDGKDAGVVTSTAHSPRYGAIGLGYVRTAFATAGITLQFADGGSAQVVELPFAE
jgi:aminomethyltransferase